MGQREMEATREFYPVFMMDLKGARLWNLYAQVVHGRAGVASRSLGTIWCVRGIREGRSMGWKCRTCPVLKKRTASDISQVGEA